MDDYAAACDRAATAQGLDPLTATLTAAGAQHYVEQTGGFTMVIAARTPHGVFTMTDDGLPLIVWQTEAAWNGTNDTDEEPFGEWTTGPEGFGRFAKVLAAMQSEATSAPSADVVEFVGLDATGREDGPHDWSAVLDAAMDLEHDAAPEPEVTVWVSTHDGVRVVQIDTTGPGRIRVNLNEAAIWDEDPETHDHEHCSTCND